MIFLKNKVIKIILIIAVLICTVMAVSLIGNNPVQRALYTMMSPAYDAAFSIVSPIRSFSERLKNADKYEAEIEQLKQENVTLKIENKSREDYIKENKRLKELLDLRDQMPSHDTITARVISYEPNSWYDTVMLNKGTANGVKKDSVVLANLGVIGKVIDVGPNWAKVSTIINISNSVGVKLSRTGDIGVVSGDASLAENKNCKLEYMSNDKNLIRGDVLVTSGLGGIYPPDLPIGKVTEINSDSAGNLEYAVVEPNVDFSSIYEVLIITYDDTEEQEETGEDE